MKISLKGDPVEIVLQRFCVFFVLFCFFVFFLISNILETSNRCLLNLQSQLIHSLFVQKHTDRSTILLSLSTEEL